MFTRNFDVIVQNGQDSRKISASRAHLRINACPRAWTRRATLKARCRTGVSKKLTKRRVFSRILRQPISPRRRDNGRRHRQNTSLRVVPRVENRFRAERHGGGGGASLLAVSGSDSASWPWGTVNRIYHTQGRIRLSDDFATDANNLYASIRLALLSLGAPPRETPMFLSPRTSLPRFATILAAEWGILVNGYSGVRADATWIARTICTAQCFDLETITRVHLTINEPRYCREKNLFTLSLFADLYHPFIAYANLSLVFLFKSHDRSLQSHNAIRNKML